MRRASPTALTDASTAASTALSSWIVGLALMLALVALAAPASAHKGSDAYLDVQQRLTPATLQAGANDGVAFDFTLAVALKDLDLLVPVDGNADGRITLGELKAAEPALLGMLNATARLEPAPAEIADAAVVTSARRLPWLTARGPNSTATSNSPANPPSACVLDWSRDGIERRSDGAYLRVVATASCNPQQALAVRYTLLAGQDATHRLLVSGHVGGHDLLTTVSPLQTAALRFNSIATATDRSTAQSTPTGSGPSRWNTLHDYFGLGLHHLLQGYDHLAFLLALVLPLQLDWRQLSRRFGARRDGPAPRRDWGTLLRTVTAFTIGHSITLLLAALGWTQASPAWVEPAIAASIAVTALLNLRPVQWLRTDVLALLFGGVHGFGFAGLLTEAAAPAGLLPWALAGFNLGIEAAQLLAVGAWVLASHWLSRRAWYARTVVRGGSVLLTLLATGWFWQRVAA